MPETAKINPIRKGNHRIAIEIEIHHLADTGIIDKERKPMILTNH